MAVTGTCFVACCSITHYRPYIVSLLPLSLPQTVFNESIINNTKWQFRQEAGENRNCISKCSISSLSQFHSASPQIADATSLHRVSPINYYITIICAIFIINLTFYRRCILSASTNLRPDYLVVVAYLVQAAIPSIILVNNFILKNANVQFLNVHVIQPCSTSSPLFMGQHRLAKTRETREKERKRRA